MSDQVIAEIERNMADFSERLGEPCMLIYTGSRLWIASCTKFDLRTTSYDVMVALRDFDAKVREYEARNVALAQTLGLEAAE